MSPCDIQESGTIELYYYGELDQYERGRVADHIRGCGPCAEMLRELKMIRTALESRPDVSGPPSGDWTPFMGRLDAAIHREEPRGHVIAFAPPSPTAKMRRPFFGVLATAALLALVTMSVFIASRAGRLLTEPPTDSPTITARSPLSTDPAEMPIREGLVSVGARHLERSKLVVLGLATKEIDPSTAADWEYERELATGLLSDTRLYRIAAEQRGLTSLASLMKDLELVLLQASMAETTDQTALPQIQRLIQKRGLVQKMDVVGTTGLVP